LFYGHSNVKPRYIDENGHCACAMSRDLQGKNLTLTMRPLGNQSPPKHVIWRKNGVDPLKNVVSRGGERKIKKNKK